MTSTAQMEFVPEESPTGQETLDALREVEVYVAQLRENVLRLQATVGASKDEITLYNYARQRAYDLGAALKRELIAAGVPPGSVPPAYMARPLEDGAPSTASRAVALGLVDQLPDGRMAWADGGERVVSLGTGPIVLVAAYWAGAPGIAWAIHEALQEGGPISRIPAFLDWLLVMVRGEVGRDVILSRDRLAEFDARIAERVRCSETGDCDPDDIDLGDFDPIRPSSGWPTALKWGIGLAAGAMVVGVGALIYVEVSSGGAIGKSIGTAAKASSKK